MLEHLAWSLGSLAIAYPLAAGAERHLAARRRRRASQVIEDLRAMPADEFDKVRAQIARWDEQDYEGSLTEQDQQLEDQQLREIYGKRRRGGR